MNKIKYALALTGIFTILGITASNAVVLDSTYSNVSLQSASWYGTGNYYTLEQSPMGSITNLTVGQELYKVTTEYDMQTLQPTTVETLIGSIQEVINVPSDGMSLASTVYKLSTAPQSQTIASFGVKAASVVTGGIEGITTGLFDSVRGFIGTLLGFIAALIVLGISIRLAVKAVTKFGSRLG